MEGRALTNKTTVAVCKFIIEDVICWYRCIGKIMANQGELDAHEAQGARSMFKMKFNDFDSYNYLATELRWPAG